MERVFYEHMFRFVSEPPYTVQLARGNYVSGGTSDMRNRHHARASHARRMDAAAKPAAFEAPTLEVMALIALATALVAAVIVSAPSHGSAAQIPTMPVKVQSGDTLWSLAADAGVPGMSTEQVASLLIELNDLEGALLHEGTIVQVPTSDSYSTAQARK
jgi:hypothetical protein